jgi:SAM-dependent methyltransferase
VACGTGKTAVALAGRGLNVLGVELDPRMADAARAHGVAVEVAPFETWDDAGRRFDLITCTSGWHWIDPERGRHKAAELLRPGGTIARFWNFYLLDDEVRAGLEALYREHAPTADAHAGGLDHDGAAPADPFATDPDFTDHEVTEYGWEKSFTAAEWTGLIATYSDHQQLPPARLEALRRAVGQHIEDAGGRIQAHGQCYLITAVRR